MSPLYCRRARAVPDHARCRLRVACAPSASPGGRCTASEVRQGMKNDWLGRSESLQAAAAIADCAKWVHMLPMDPPPPPPSCRPSWSLAETAATVPFLARGCWDMPRCDLATRCARHYMRDQGHGRRPRRWRQLELRQSSQRASGEMFLGLSCCPIPSINSIPAGLCWPSTNCQYCRDGS